MTGDETGLLKFVNLKTKKTVSYGEQSRDCSIKGVKWIEYGIKVAVTRINGDCEVWCVNDSRDGLEQHLGSSMSSGVNGIIGTASCSGNALDATASILYNQAGAVHLWKHFPSSSSSQPSSKKKKGVVSDFTVDGPLHCCSASKTQAIFGGRENDVKLWDLATQTCTFKAKNVPDDEVRLRVPVWVTDVTFIKPDIDGNSDLIVTGTGYKDVRMYDMRTGRQPVKNFNTGAFRVTRILPTQSGDELLVSDTIGTCMLWDLRTERRCRSYRGCNGAIRDMSMSANGNIVTIVGLDRHLRVIDLNRKKFSSHVYLKSRTNACCVYSDELTTASSGIDDDDDDNSDDEDDEDDDDSNASDRVEELLSSSGDEDEGDFDEGSESSDDGENGQDM